ncbi:hypothetical protein KRMM14A1259_67800 [Krasilnikovia sp. MM14-A1259]
MLKRRAIRTSQETVTLASIQESAMAMGRDVLAVTGVLLAVGRRTRANAGGAGATACRRGPAVPGGVVCVRPVTRARA